MSHPQAAAPHPYSALTPDVVLDACDAAGFRADGRLLPLNSYENRVYQVWLDDGSARVLKFYRPGRWSREQIEEEHAFARELAEREIPVVAPVYTGAHAGFLFAVYPRRGGRTPELDNPKTRWGRRAILNSGTRYPSIPSGASRAPGCSSTASCRPTCSTRGRPLRRRR